MTTYWGGVWMVVMTATTFVAGAPLWVAILIGLAALVAGHYVDPHTKWGRSQLSAKRARETTKND